MSLKIIPTPQFKRSVKQLYKRYKLLAKDLKELEQELLKNPNAGIGISHNCFKIRLKNSSIPTGKSGGFRVIYYLKTEEKIYLLEIFSKTDMENIDENKLISILKDNSLN